MRPGSSPESSELSTTHISASKLGSGSYLWCSLREPDQGLRFRFKLRGLRQAWRYTALLTRHGTVGGKSSRSVGGGWYLLRVRLLLFLHRSGFAAGGLT